MKKRFLCFVLVALTLLVGISVTACGRDDNDNTSGDVDGKYYGYGFYENADGEEEGFVELKNGKCIISGDSPAKELDFTVNGNYFAGLDPESIDFSCGVAGIINNGVILIPFDGTYTMYCKEGKTPQDLFENLSGVEGKYLSYYDGFYNQRNAMAIVGNAFVSYGCAGTVSRNGDMLKCTVTFIDKQGFVSDTDSNTVLCDIIKNNALIVNEVYTDVESGEQYEYTTSLCKVGYDTDGNAITGEHVVTLDTNGGYSHSWITPMQTLTVNGTVYLGLYEYNGYYSGIYKQHNVVDYKYNCVGFNTEPDGSGVEYYDGIEIEEDTVFYAVWEESKYDG